MQEQQGADAHLESQGAQGCKGRHGAQGQARPQGTSGYAGGQGPPGPGVAPAFCSATNNTGLVSLVLSPGQAVPFNELGPCSGITQASPTTFVLPTAGTYEVTFKGETAGTTQDAVAVELNDVLTRIEAHGDSPLVANGAITVTAGSTLRVVSTSTLRSRSPLAGRSRSPSIGSV